MLSEILKRDLNVDTFSKSVLSAKQVEELYKKMTTAHCARGGKINVEMWRMNSLYRDFVVETIGLYFKLLKILDSIATQELLVKQSVIDGISVNDLKINKNTEFTLADKVEYIKIRTRDNLCTLEKLSLLISIYTQRLRNKKVIDFARERNGGMLPIPSFRGQYLSVIRHFVFDEAWDEHDKELKNIFLNKDLYKQLCSIMYYR